MTVGAVQRFTSWLLGRSANSPAAPAHQPPSASASTKTPGAGPTESSRRGADDRRGAETQRRAPAPPVLRAPTRQLDRLVVSKAPKRILEIGLTNLADTQQMLAFAVQSATGPQEPLVEYVAVDRFEAREADLPPISLKKAHCELRAEQVRLQLIPGELYAALERNANSLGKFDLCVINGTADMQALERGWFYFPRMLQADAVVLVAQADGSYQSLSQAEIAARAQRGAQLRRAA